MIVRQVATAASVLASIWLFRMEPCGRYRGMSGSASGGAGAATAGFLNTADLR
jgi:hypothetical protein